MTLKDWLVENDDTDNSGGHIVEQWTGIDEAGNSVDINTISSGSGKKMLWRCSEGHQWYATINSRTSSKRGCKQCYENGRKQGKFIKKPVDGKDLYSWCLMNNYGSIIIKEWTGRTVDNTEIDIKKTAVQSNKDVYWICSKNSEHTWHTKIQKRTLLNSGCPYCCGQKPSQTNNLKQYCLENNLEYLIDEFVGLDENNTLVDMTQLTKLSHRKVKWKHRIREQEHGWVASISDRVYNHSMCPECNSRNKLVQGKNDLLTWCENNSEVGNSIIDAWIGVDEYFNEISIDNISYGSKTKVFLQCECGNIFLKEPIKITYNRSVLCKDCVYQARENKKYNTLLKSGKTLKEWCNKNSLYGKKIQSEFVGKDCDGNTIELDKITYGSTKKVMWRHTTKSGELHTWSATVHNRICNKSMCPICNNKGTSLPEQIIYRCLKQIYPNIISRGQFQGYEFDITIPEIKTCIEYGSTYYHNDRQERDKEKQELCERYNVNFIRIIDDSNKELEEIWSDNLIITRIEINKVKCIEEIVKHLCSTFSIYYKDINFKEAVNDAIEFMSN